MEATMRTRLSWILILAALALIFTGCNSLGIDDDDDDDGILHFNGSDTFLQEMRIGNVPIQVGGTYNCPLAITRKITFETSRPVTIESLGQLFQFQFMLTNMDTGMTYLITDANLNSNGDLYFVSDTTIEYRLFHGLDRLTTGGQDYILGSPGDTFRVDVQFVIGMAKDGTQFAFTDDTFFIVYTDSNQTL